MEIRHLDHEGEVTTQFEHMPVPAARPLSDFCMERVGDDVVLYDPENIQYHTLNTIAFDVWRLCDGTRSVEEITSELATSGISVHLEAVALAVAQLEEASLVQSRASDVELRIQRRKVIKMAAVGVMTAAALPVVTSITAPEAAAQGTCNPRCTGQRICCGGVCLIQSGSNCQSNAECCSGTCNPGPPARCA